MCISSLYLCTHIDVLPFRYLAAGRGLRFRADLSAFGGPGLGYACELLQRGSKGPRSLLV